MQSESRRGVILPTALFVSMVVLLLATGIASETYLNLRFTGLEAERTRLTFQAQGAANEFIWGMNSDPAYLSFTAANPRVDHVGEVTVQSWSEVDAAAPQLRRVSSRAYVHSAAQAATFSRVVRTVNRAVGEVYTNVPDQQPGVPDSIFHKAVDASSWTLLPPAPRWRYTQAGVLETDPTTYAGTLLFAGVDTHSNFYAIYPPALDGYSINPPGPGPTALQLILGRAQSGQTLLTLMPVAQDVVESLGATDESLSQCALVLKYDGNTHQWHPLPPAPDALDSPGGPVPDFTNYILKGLCGPIAIHGDDLYVPIYRRGPDVIYKFHFDGVGPTTGSWTMLPYVPDGAGNPTHISQVAVDGLGRVFVVSTGYPNGPDRVVQLQGGAWVPLPEQVPASLYDGSGQLQEDESQSPYQLGPLVASSDGTLYVVSMSDIDTVFKYAGGKWVAVPNQENLSHAGTGPPSTQVKKADIGVDSEGHLVVRSGVASAPDEIWVQTPTGFKLQPPLPKIVYDAAGNAVNQGGSFSYSSQVMAGGSFSAPSTGYLPTASF